MAVSVLRFLTQGLPPRVIFYAITLVSLTLLAESVRNVTGNSNTAVSGEIYSALWVLNGISLFILAALVIGNIAKLRGDYRRKHIGSRLTLRLVALFASLAIVPTSIIFFFSLQFVRDGINQWYDSGVDQQLESALALSRAAIDMQIRAYKHRTVQVAQQFTSTEHVSPMGFDTMRERIGAEELTLFANNGAVPLFASEDPVAIVPTPMSNAAYVAVKQGNEYVAVDPSGNRNMMVAVVLPVTLHGSTQPHYLQALFPLSDRLNALAESVQAAYQQYKKKQFLHEPLALTYTASLAVIMLVTLMGAIWLAFYAAKRMVDPVRELAAGTRAVAQGDYSKQLAIPSRDELGILVASFNAMTRRIAQSRDDAAQSQQLAESQRAYLEAVLSCLSSGVITLDADYRLRTVNPRVAAILGEDLQVQMGTRIDVLIAEYPALTRFFHAVASRISRAEQHWTDQLQLKIAGQSVDLLCSGSQLTNKKMGDDAGYVIVFEDISTLLRAQKDAAWGEVARRLAHEIKNPLTPIQLSAERIKHKLSGSIDPKQQELVEKATATIVSQVDHLKTMVNAFAEYAKAPELTLEAINVNQVIDEVVNLYRGNSVNVHLSVDLDASLPFVKADSGRLRQLLHNLIKNALEAVAQVAQPRVTISTDVSHDSDGHYVHLAIWDNGAGFPDALLGPVFEPYVTTKERGTGLGLAIVQKIVEEHAATIVASNREEGGAQLLIKFIAYQPSNTADESKEEG